MPNSDNQCVRPTNVAGSVVLSGLSAFLLGVALLLGYSGISLWWGALVIWIVSPPLLLITGAYIVHDVLSANTRRQAVLAMLFLIPIAALVWHWRFRGI